MNCTIVEETIDQLQTHGGIPIRFEVKSIFEIEGDDPKTATLVEKRLVHPWIKDYDPACRFYKKQGCRLTAISRGTYEDSPDEIELIWSLTL